MRHLDLFSGIGGFSLAADWVWGDEHEIVSFVEIDPFCQKVLKKHWPETPIHDDIRTLDYEKIMAYAERNGKKRNKSKNWQGGNVEQNCKNGGEPVTTEGFKWGEYHQPPTIGLLTGGFPCQPFSCAGKRRGAEDDRALWPEMYRIIRECKPRWIIGENVAGIINMELDTVLADLEDAGYTPEPFVIPACAVDAPHRRDRVWIVAYKQSIGLQGGCQRQRGICKEMQRGGISSSTPSSSQDVADTERKGLEGRANQRNAGSTFTGPREGRGARQANWLPEPGLGRVVDGLSTEMDGNLRRTEYATKHSDTKEAISAFYGYRGRLLFSMWKREQGSKAPFRAGLVGVHNSMSEMSYQNSYEEWVLGQRIKETKELHHMWQDILSKPFKETQDLQQEMLERIGQAECAKKMASERVNRLKSIGNAIVPQVVVPIMQAIKEIEADN